MVATMTDQVKLATPHLKVGAVYLFDHVRKGPFVGVYKGVKPAKPGDPQDEVFFEVDVYTEDGSGSERLANAFVRDELGRKTHPEYSLKYIRPSLLVTVTSPSTQARADMTQRYADTIARGKKLAEDAGLPDPVLPAISIPTAQAMGRLTGVLDTASPAPVAAAVATSHRLLYAGLAAGAAAAGLIGYLVLGG